MANNPILNYFNTISDRYKRGTATEHTYRGDLQKLIEALVSDVVATNEPKRQACGAPDYIITRKDIPLGFVEAKDVGEPLDKVEKSEQLKRYRESLDNLILTDYLEFRLFRNGEKVTTISLASIEKGKLQPNKEGWAAFEGLIKDFCSFQGQTITSAEKLAKMMAAKARMMQLVLENALKEDQEDELNNDSSLEQQYNAFKDILIHDIKLGEFADIYAQTIAYGMFAARLHDTTLADFTRKEAAELIPKSNPFLRKLFQYIAGFDLDDRLVWIVDTLADVFRATDVNAILKNFGKGTQMSDPIIHFYETFLSEYNPALRKSRGVWYTPAPVVNFIVRAVDDILKGEFKLKDGLANTETTEIEIKTQNKDARTKDNLKKGRVTVHKVQILDPATGTGTFLSEVIKHIYKKFDGQQGIWNNYVEKHLIPRLNGFEILMASYAMCHLKLELLLAETGYESKNSKRLRVYLTNSLEEATENNVNLFTQWLSNEAIEANGIKRDTPVMVVLGNPPYSGHSSNNSPWIEKLIEDYKQEPTGGKLKEQNSKWINDDYVKFIRYSQEFIHKNGEGVLAFITNNGYLDNPTFRGMRYNLLQEFNTIYIIDLHGSAKKQETAPDGSKDDNVFDIQQGVSIILAIKNRGKKDKGVLKSFDLFGKREIKYNFLLENSLKSVPFETFTPFAPNYLFKNLDVDLVNKYNLGFNAIELFRINVMGFQTHRDDFAVDFSKKEIKKRAEALRDKTLSNEEIFEKYDIKDNRDWKLAKARNEIQSDKEWEKKIIHCNYRPFDDRHCYFSYVMMDYPRKEMLQHIANRENYNIGIGRQGVAVGDLQWCLTTISRHPIDANVFRRGGINVCPLYLYPDNEAQTELHMETSRVPNFKKEILDKIVKGLKLQFETEKSNKKETFAPIDILDYIYAILHSPKYRDKYKEFLKIDFPRIPYPTDKDKFWSLVKLGAELRQLHLLETKTVEKYITTYPVNGSNEVVKPKFEANKVWINDEQYFAKVPPVAWEFWIGGYQPAQKWLKDRQGRNLEYDDILHYQKMIVALTETDRIMKELDKIKII